MSLDFNQKSIVNIENKKIGFCFKYCHFEKEKYYDDKSKILKIFKRMAVVSNDYFFNKDIFFIKNNCNDLIQRAEWIMKKSEKLYNNIYDMFKGDNAFRVYGFFKENIFYVLEVDMKHKSRPDHK